MHCFFNNFSIVFYIILFQKSMRILPKIDSKRHRFFDRFFHRFFFDFGSILEANLGTKLATLGHLLGSWRPLGGLLGRLGGLLGPLGGQDPPEARGRCFWEASSGRLGLIFGRFLDGFFNGFSILFLSYLSRHQHVAKPQNNYFCSTREPLEVLRVQYF